MGTLHLSLIIIQATMVSLVLSLLLPFMALAAPGSQERGLLGDLTTAPFDFAGCLSKCPISPLEFPECSVACAKETNSGDNRGLVADFTACTVSCKLNPDGTCDASKLTYSPDLYCLDSNN